MRRTIWIGVADSIKVSMEDKCGGVVVKSKKMLQVVSSQNTKRKRKMKKMMILKIKKRISFVKWNLLNVNVASKQGIPHNNVKEIQIWDQVWMLFWKLLEYKLWKMAGSCLLILKLQQLAFSKTALKSLKEKLKVKKIHMEYHYKYMNRNLNF